MAEILFSDATTQYTFTPPANWQALENIFDRLYKKAVTLNQEKSHLLCNVQQGRCAKGREQGGKGFCCGANTTRANGTTEACQHLGDAGCTVESLRCKLWFCSAIKSQRRSVPARIGIENTLETADDNGFEDLVHEANFYGLLVHRGTREQSLKQACRKWGLEYKNER